MEPALAFIGTLCSLGKQLSGARQSLAVSFCAGIRRDSVLDWGAMKPSSSFLLTAVAALALTACNHTQPAHSSGRPELFNGKNLDGWQYSLADAAVPRDAVWSVRDGIILCQGEPLGVLYTTETFTNFRLRLEYRWAPGSKPGNSGILTRINGPTRALPRCAEVQLQHGNAGDVLGLQGMTVAAGQPRSFELKAHAVAGDVAGVKKLVDAEKRAGEWNRVELLAQGSTYTVWVNGQKVNDASGVEVLAGPIGLQSEGGQIQFRHVTVTRLGE